MFKYSKKEFFKELQEVSRPQWEKTIDQLRGGTLNKLLGRARERSVVGTQRGGVERR